MKTTGWVILAIGAGLLAALFVALRPDPPPPPAAAPAAATPAPVAFELQVRDGRLAAGPATLAVEQGAAVVLRVTSDRAAELHLHGYDLTLALTPNVPGELRFTARHAGRFEFELHGHHGGDAGGHDGLGALEVLPKR